MEFNFHSINGKIIAELIDKSQVINCLDDAIDLLGNASYGEATKVIVYEHQLHPDFFELRTRFAGDVLQKYSNYRMRLSIVGDFSKFESKSLRDFIYESNKTGQVTFVESLEQAME